MNAFLTIDIVAFVSSWPEWTVKVHSWLALPLLRGWAPYYLLTGLGIFLCLWKCSLRQHWSLHDALYLLPGCLSWGLIRFARLEIDDGLLIFWDVLAFILIYYFLSSSFDDLYRWKTHTTRREKDVEWRQWLLIFLLAYLWARTVRSERYDLQECTTSLQHLKLSLNNASSALQHCTATCVPRTREFTPKTMCGSIVGPHLTFERFQHDVRIARNFNTELLHGVVTDRSPGSESIIEGLKKDRRLYNVVLEELRISDNAFRDHVHRTDNAVASAALVLMRHPENSTRLTCQALNHLSTIMKDYTASMTLVSLPKSFYDLTEGTTSRLKQFSAQMNSLQPSKLSWSGLMGMRSLTESQQLLAKLESLLQAQMFKALQAKELKAVFSFYIDANLQAERQIEELRDDWCKASSGEDGDRVAPAVVLSAWGDNRDSKAYDSLCVAYTILTEPAKFPIDSFMSSTEKVV